MLPTPSLARPGSVGVKGGRLDEVLHPEMCFAWNDRTLQGKKTGQTAESMTAEAQAWAQEVSQTLWVEAGG